MGYLEDFGKRLLEITKNCRYDMHEPDEQGLSAFVIGNELDNAFGEDINVDMLKCGHQEIVVVLKREDVIMGEMFNLATLIALARVGAKTIVGD